VIRAIAMDFLSVVPDLALSEDAGKQHTFCADVFDKRPPFEEMQRFASWSDEIQEQMQLSMQRRACPVKWVGLFVDQKGMLALFQFVNPVILAHAKTSAEVIMHALPKDQQRAVYLGLRPLDELDQKRINAWKTTAALRPESDSESESEEPCDEAPRPVAELLAREPPAKRRRCQDLALSMQPQQDLALVGTDHTATWAYLARLYATVHVLSAGNQPSHLGYIRCHREARRVMLLVEAVKTEYERASLRSVVKTAVLLAKNGALPTYEGARCRRTEFLRRCLAARNVITPGPQTAVTEAVLQQFMAIIGGQEETKGCQHNACKGMKTRWIVCQPGLSRCSRCNMPKSYGRSWKSVRDFVGLRPLA
jgi:hypothetical protein